jgi:aryl-alcohol dehydrogenase-like predicted oxidoreductase
MAYGPLAHGLLTGRYNATTTFPNNDWRSKSDIFKGDLFKKNLAVVDQLQQIAQERRCDLPQLATAWVLAHPAVDCAIVGTLNAHEIADTAAAADIQLSQADLSRIDGIMRQAITVGGPSPEGTFTTDASPHPMQAQTDGDSPTAPI